VFSCCFRHSKQAVYRCFNAIFGKIGRTASDEVIIELFKKKCLALLFYGNEACPMKKYHIASLQFLVNTCFAKIFNTRSKDYDYVVYRHDRSSVGGGVAVFVKNTICSTAVEVYTGGLPTY